MRVFQLGSVNCLVGCCLAQGDLGCSGNGALAALTSPKFSVQGCSVETALEAASLHPAQLLGIEHKKGTLNYDSDAGTGVGTAHTGMETIVSGVLEQSRSCFVSICSSPVLVGACSTWDMLWAFAPVVFPLDAGGVWETLWSALHISVEQKAELPLPGLHCSAILGWGEALPQWSQLSPANSSSSILTAAFFLSYPTQIS